MFRVLILPLDLLFTMGGFGELLSQGTSFPCNGPPFSIFKVVKWVIARLFQFELLVEDDCGYQGNFLLVRFSFLGMVAVFGCGALPLPLWRVGGCLGMWRPCRGIGFYMGPSQIRFCLRHHPTTVDCFSDLFKFWWINHFWFESQMLDSKFWVPLTALVIYLFINKIKF